MKKYFREITKKRKKEEKRGKMPKITKAENLILTKLKYFYKKLLRIYNQL